ncbi:hypothetical protein ACIQM4_19905 [Streptomyces sp. NPDC091272]|uniref:hypothetical protein n=1 Tax=Streptomyces sp. NPDC091272 TaxID=3365981 RepID=UPI00382AC00D
MRSTRSISSASSVRSLRTLTGLALAGAALVVSAPYAQAVTPSCQKALDDAEIAQRNSDIVNKDPNASAEDRKRAQDEANMTASTAQRFCNSTDPAVTGPVRGGEGGSQSGTGPAEIAGGTALLAVGAVGAALVVRRRAAAGRG